MSKSSNNQIGGNSAGRMPSDEQMDALLKDFFRYEVPIELNQSFRGPAVVASQTLVVTQDRISFQTGLRRQPKIIVASALALLALSLVMFVQVNEKTSATLAGKKSTSNEDLMLVSPKADSKTGEAVSDDGVTLEETDSIELKPQPR